MIRKLITITVSIVSVLFLALILFLYFNYSAKTAQKFYKQGLEFVKKGDLQNAYYNFGRVPFSSSIKDLAVYKQAWCSKNLGDRKAAIKKYKNYIQRVDDEVMAPVGHWELGLLYLEDNKKKKAYETFKKLVKNYPKSDYAMAANYQIGALLSVQNPISANKYFIEYLKYAPVGRYANESISYIQSSKTNLSDEQKYYLALALYENKRYTESVLLLKEIPFSKAWYYLGKNNEAAGTIGLALENYLEGLMQADKETDVEHIINALESYVKLSEKDKKEALRTLAYVLKDTKSAAYPGALYNFSKYLTRAEAIKNYEKIYTDYPHSFWASESLWEVFWMKYKARDYKTALKLAKEHIGEYRNTKASPRILFWCAKIYEKAKNKAESDKLYKKIVENFPDNYYAFRANEQLMGNKHPFKADKTLPVKEDTVPKFPYKNGSKTMDSLNILAELDDKQTIEDFRINDDFVKSWILNSKGNFSQSVLVAREAMSGLSEKPSPKDNRWQLVYPIHFGKEINLFAKKHNVSPYLTLSIIREESYFNPEAVSYVGALGLMQLMPQTASYVGGAAYEPSKITEPGYNIYMGTKYFAIALNDLHNNEMLAVLGYNSGPGSVKGWISQVEHNDPDEFIEDVPYDETRNYVKKIYATYWNYLRIYE